MKNIKWHKFGIVAFSIWMLNGIAQIKLGGFKPYAIAMITFIIIVCSMSSCSVVKTSHRPCKPLNKALTLNKTRQKVERMTNPNRQFLVVNNEIIMFENN
jgi:hypothetical protein